MQNNDSLLAPYIKNVHFIGIGGISMSGLAEILQSRGYRISGSDMNASAITKKLEARNMKITIGHSENNIEGTDLVVYTAAVKDNNPELMAARSKGIPTMDRATLLGQIMKGYTNSIAISGTHGKTTTTSMTSMIMMEAALDPTIHIGGELEAIKGTTKIGSNEYFVAEACEYCSSFLKFYPTVAIILNMDFDHADYFRNLEHVVETFGEFARRVPADGYLVVNAEDKNINTIISMVRCNIVTFGMNPDKADWSAIDINYDDMACASYTLVHKGNTVGIIELKVPGIHNVGNSLAAIAACSLMGCSYDSFKAAFAKFSGTHRRFELKGLIGGIKVIDDYAHHPSEIRATLKAAKNCGHTRVWCVFQPHTYTRTKSFMDQFAVSFKDADKVILADIYAAREQDTGEVNSSMMADRINANEIKAEYIKDFEAIVSYLDENVKPGDLVITMGAGDIYKVGEIYLSHLSALQDGQ